MTVQIISGFDPWSYDVDKDCRISQTELLAAFSDYVHGIITDDQELQVAALYENNTVNPDCELPTPPPTPPAPPTPVPGKGFTLCLINTYFLDAKWWWADYNRGTVYSGWIDISKGWSCPYNASGVTDLTIALAKADYTVLSAFTVPRQQDAKLGPLEDGADYVYDYNVWQLIKLSSPHWTLDSHTVYPLASTYYGDAARFTIAVKFAPQGFPGGDWLKEQLIDTLEDRVGRLGDHMLELDLYRNVDSPWWSTDWKFVVTTTGSSPTFGQIIAILLIILAAYLIITFAPLLFEHIKYGTRYYGNLAISAKDAVTDKALTGIIVGYDGARVTIPATIKDLLADSVYTITWGDKSGYQTPDLVKVTIAKNLSTPVVGLYWPVGVTPPTTGVIIVSSSPSKAKVWADTQEGTTPVTFILPKGDYTVSFADIKGYVTPSPKTLTLQAGDKLQVSGIYKSGESWWASIPDWAKGAAIAAMAIGGMALAVGVGIQEAKKK